jgi:hypothetical protein
MRWAQNNMLHGHERRDRHADCDHRHDGVHTYFGHVPDAGSYAPLTILLEDRPDGVHLTYDKMVSFLAPYRNAEALTIARDLDSAIERLF